MDSTRARDRGRRTGIAGLLAIGLHVGAAALLSAADANATEPAPASRLMWIELGPDPGNAGAAHGQPEGQPMAASERTAVSGDTPRTAARSARPRSARARAPRAERPLPSPVAPAGPEPSPPAEAVAAIYAETGSAETSAGALASAAALGAPADTTGTGTAALGAPAGTAGTGTAAGSGPEPGTAGAGELLRRPRLLASADPCAGYFPAAAQARVGEVRIRALVDSTGHARLGRVLQQRPLGQGFDRAARACLDRLRFDPALDRRGVTVEAEATLHIRFVRR